MAYSNWGAFVYCNGERRTDKEDTSVFEHKDARCFHAVLGDEEIRLCGYKCYPELWQLKDGVLKQIDIDQFEVDGTENYEGTIDGYGFIARQYDDNMLALALKQPDGTKWTGDCGYKYGAGHMD